MRIERRYTTDGQSPYADIAFRLTTSEIRNPDGSVVFRADDVEIPVLARGSAVSPVVFDLLVECAEREKIPFSIQAAPHDTGTDADAIYNALRGIPTGLVSVPNRYMHSPNEMVARDDLERAARLLAAFARRLDPKISFIPA